MRLLAVLPLCVCGCGPLLIGAGFSSAFSSSSTPDTVTPAVAVQRLNAFSDFTNEESSTFNFVINKNTLKIEATVERLDELGNQMIPREFVMEQEEVESPFVFQHPGDGAYRLIATVKDPVGESVDFHDWVVDSNPPTSPDGLRAEDITKQTITLRWEESTDGLFSPGGALKNPGSGVVAYRVHYDLLSEFFGTQTADERLALQGAGAVILDLVKNSPANVGNRIRVPIDFGDLRRQGVQVADEVFLFRVSAVDEAGNESEFSAELQVRLLRGGTGEFAPPDPTGVGSNPIAVVVGDFTNDRILDLAVLNAGDPVTVTPPSLSILVGQGAGGRGDGTFLRPGADIVLRAGALKIETGDFNQDGNLDVVVATDLGGDVMLGLGNGTFTPLLAQFPFAADDGTFLLGDFNSNGLLDAFKTAGNARGTVFPGQLGQPLLFGAQLSAGTNLGTVPTVGVVGDFDSDGILDLALAHAAEATILLLDGNGGNGQGNGQHSLDPERAQAGHIVQDVVVADFDSDGIDDLATISAQGGDLRVLLGHGDNGKGDGSFGVARESFSDGQSPSGIVCGDFDSDGILDLAVANAGSDDVSVFIGEGFDGVGTGTFSDAVPFPAGDEPSAIASADFDADGVPDLVTTNKSKNTVSVLLGLGSDGTGDGTFTIVAEGEIPTNEIPLDIVSADFNSDGILDLAVAVNSSTDTNTDPVPAPSVLVYLGRGSDGRGDGTFADPVSFSLDGAGVGGPAVALVAADVHADKILDLVVLRKRAGTGAVGVLKGVGDNGRGTGNFAAAQYPITGKDQLGAITTADLDNDKILDLLVASPDNSLFFVFPGGGSNGQGDGTFADAPALDLPDCVVVQNNATGVATGDFNADRVLDFAGASDVVNRVHVFRGPEFATRGMVEAVTGTVRRITGTVDEIAGTVESVTPFDVDADVSGITGSKDTIVANDPALSSEDGFYVGLTVTVTAIGMGGDMDNLDETRTISNYDGNTKVITVSLDFPELVGSNDEIKIEGISAITVEADAAIFVATDGFYNGMTFDIDGKPSRTIATYDESAREFTFERPFGVAPTAADTFVIEGRDRFASDIDLAGLDPTNLQLRISGQPRTIDAFDAATGTFTLASNLASVPADGTSFRVEGRDLFASNVDLGGASPVGMLARFTTGPLVGQSQVVDTFDVGTGIFTFVSPFSAIPGNTRPFELVQDSQFDSDVVMADAACETVRFTSGALAGQVWQSSYVAATGTFFLNTGQSDAPANGDRFTVPSEDTTSFAAGAGPAAIVSGEFTGDRILDLAVANRGGGTVSVLAGQADTSGRANGLFAELPTRATVETDPTFLLKGDFNEDGLLDLAVANTGSGTVSILLGNGNGTFRAGGAPPILSYATGAEPVAIASGDFNGDGVIDLAVAHRGERTIHILFGVD